MAARDLDSYFFTKLSTSEALDDKPLWRFYDTPLAQRELLEIDYFLSDAQKGTTEAGHPINQVWGSESRRQKHNPQAQLDVEDEAQILLPNQPFQAAGAHQSLSKWRPTCVFRGSLQFCAELNCSVL